MHSGHCTLMPSPSCSFKETLKKNDMGFVNNNNNVANNRFGVWEMS